MFTPQGCVGCFSAVSLILWQTALGWCKNSVLKTGAQLGVLGVRRGERLGGVEDSFGKSKWLRKWAAYPQLMEEITSSLNADLFILERFLSLKPSHSHGSLQLALSPPISFSFSLFLEKTTLRKTGWKNTGKSLEAFPRLTFQGSLYDSVISKWNHSK